VFSKNALVSHSSLCEKGLLRSNETAKILGGKIGLTIPLRISVPVSKSAGKIIEKAGGTIVLEK
jgi:ribosomal protein L15